MPGLDALDDNLDDEPNPKTNLMELVNNARSSNPEIQLNAIQGRFFQKIYEISFFTNLSGFTGHNHDNDGLFYKYGLTDKILNTFSRLES